MKKCTLSNLLFQISEEISRYDIVIIFLYHGIHKLFKFDYDLRVKLTVKKGKQ